VATELPITLAALRTLVTDAVAPTATFSRAVVLQAINYGYGRALRALRSVRPQHLLSFVDNFSLTSQTAEYDISSVTPPIWRLVKLVVPRIPAVAGLSGGSSRVVLFQYRDFRDPDFENLEATASGASDRIVYDILEGLLPKTTTSSAVTTTVSTLLTGNLDQIQVVSATDIAIGDPIRILGVGQGQVLDAEGAEPDYTLDRDYFGRVVGVSGTTITVSPRMRLAPVVGIGVTTYRTRILTIAPVPGSDLSGRLYYLAQNPKLAKDADLVDPIISEHRDVVVSYAVAWLLRTTNDQEAERWFSDAQEQRSELLQDVEPLSAQQAEALSSGLPLGDW